jgi:hypothetical protein
MCGKVQIFGNNKITFMNKLKAGWIQEMSATFWLEIFFFQFDIQKHKY